MHALPAEAKLEGEWNQRVRHFSHHIVVRSVQLPPVLLLRGFPHLKVSRFWNFKFLKSGLLSAFNDEQFMENMIKIYDLAMQNTISFHHVLMLNIRYSEKATKSWKNLLIFLTILDKIKKIGRFFFVAFLEYFQNNSEKLNWRLQHNNSF